MHDLGMAIHTGVRVIPSIDWSNHSNDEQNYNGDSGVELAFTYARQIAEMSEFNPEYRWGWDWDDCATSRVAEHERIRAEMIANGTWVEPPKRGVLEIPCESFRTCIRPFPWEIPDHGNLNYWRRYFESFPSYGTL